MSESGQGLPPRTRGERRAFNDLDIGGICVGRGQPVGQSDREEDLPEWSVKRAVHFVERLPPRPPVASPPSLEARQYDRIADTYAEEDGSADQSGGQISQEHARREEGQGRGAPGGGGARRTSGGSDGAPEGQPRRSAPR